MQLHQFTLYQNILHIASRFVPQVKILNWILNYAWFYFLKPQLFPHWFFSLVYAPRSLPNSTALYRFASPSFLLRVAYLHAYAMYCPLFACWWNRCTESCVFHFPNRAATEYNATIFEYGLVTQRRTSNTVSYCTTSRIETHWPFSTWILCCSIPKAYCASGARCNEAMAGSHDCWRLRFIAFLLIPVHNHDFTSIIAIPCVHVGTNIGLRDARQCCHPIIIDSGPLSLSAHLSLPTVTPFLIETRPTSPHFIICVVYTPPPILEFRTSFSAKFSQLTRHLSQIRFKFKT